MSVSSEPSSWLQSSLTPSAAQLAESSFLTAAQRSSPHVGRAGASKCYRSVYHRSVVLSRPGPRRLSVQQRSPGVRSPSTCGAARPRAREAAPGGRAGGALRLSLPPRAPARPRYRITAKLHPRSTPIYIQIARVPAFMSPVKGLAKGGCNPISRSFKGMSAEWLKRDFFFFKL